MHVSIEEAIRLAIISRPECFGLIPEDVNPLLLFVMRMTSGEEIECDDLPAFCFDPVRLEILTRYHSHQSFLLQVQHPVFLP